MALATLSFNIKILLPEHCKTFVTIRLGSGDKSWLTVTVFSTSFVIFGAVEKVLAWLLNARQVKLLSTCSLTLVYPTMNILRNTIRSEWAPPVFVAVQDEHRLVIKQQLMLLKLQQLTSQATPTQQLPKLHHP